MRKAPSLRKSAKQANELEFLVDKLCLLQEGGTWQIVQIESFAPNVQAKLIVKSSLNFSRRSKIFENLPYILNHELNISLDRSFGSITLAEYEGQTYFLSFNFGYFTTRLFIMPQYVERFLNEDTTWYESFLDEYLI